MSKLLLQIYSIASITFSKIISTFFASSLLNFSSTNLIISFSGSSISEFKEILLRLEDEEGIDGYEINVSCPNVENEGLAFGVDAKIVNKLTNELSKLTTRELTIKLSPNVTDIKEIAKAAEDGGADSLSLINTLLGMAIDWKTGKIY